MPVNALLKSCANPGVRSANVSFHARTRSLSSESFGRVARAADWPLGGRFIQGSCAESLMRQLALRASANAFGSESLTANSRSGLEAWLAGVEATDRIAMMFGVH